MRNLYRWLKLWKKNIIIQLLNILFGILQNKMEIIDYLQKLIDWDVDADAKFVYIRIDG